MSVHEVIADLPAPKPLRLRDTALFLDLDGTLAPLAARPQDVRPDPRRTGLLERLRVQLDGRLAVVSGRTLIDVDRILERCVGPVAAVHGLVRRDPQGRIFATPPHPKLALAAEHLRAFAAKDSGLLVEEKGLSAALHYRLAPRCAEAARACAADLARKTGLILQIGDMVAELRTPGADKGDAIRAFMAEPPFRGAMPVFVGDDATDEAGFAATRAFAGLGVLVSPADRATRAGFRLPGVDATLRWLEAAQ